MTTLPSTLTASDARTNLYDMLEEVSTYLRRFIITHKGQPRAVLMPIEDLESWDETLEIMSNKKLMKELKQARKDFEQGKFISLEELKKQYE